MKLLLEREKHLQAEWSLIYFQKTYPDVGRTAPPGMRVNMPVQLLPRHSISQALLS
jgi:hypothetical protein